MRKLRKRGKNMAEIYSYMYKGKLAKKQVKSTTAMPLDKARIWLDFNEVVGADEDGNSNLYLFSQADIVNDSQGNDVKLTEGMVVSVYDEDTDQNNFPDAMLADGIIMRNTLKQYPQVKWLIQLVSHNSRYKHGLIYIYWMSDVNAQL